MAEVVINEKQQDTLKKIVEGGKVSPMDINADMRTVNALQARGLVKVRTTAKGSSVSSTAKGRKYFN